MDIMGDISGTFGLVLLALKIVALLFIISFVKSRFGNSWFATALAFVLAYIVLFQAWTIFAPIILIYMFIIFGFTGILFDLSIAKPWKSQGGGGADGKDSKSREAMQSNVGRYK